MKQKNEISAKKIAEMAGVSPSTVSMVLNNKGDEFRIAAKTCEKILQAANDLGYQHVSRTRHKRKNLNRMLISTFCSKSFDRGPTEQFYVGATKFITEQRLPYEISLFPYWDGKLQDKAMWLSSEFSAGAVLMNLTENDIEFIEKNTFDIPLVLYNRTAKGYCSVLTDDYSIGNKAMNHFIKRGHTKFGLISPNFSSRALSLRAVGYTDKLQHQGFKPGEMLLVPTAYGEDNDDGGYESMQKILQAEMLPTALFLLSDNMVSGVVRCIHDHGFEIPKDFEIITFGNRTIGRIISPSISSFAPPVEEMSYNCMRLLHRFIKEGVWTDNVKLSFESECIFRESCPEI